ncbi:hypothetical protein Ddye_015150 [Dipteronia dyeriana]|uniref:Uncharacterized protein n=1 Tax=Dipteronia dyeriana TaxID=168575 RepID=A0AAD9U531_9ROSI|nr:hypothetical protein Ddye_015150 [Dipteronia dyeriana]
MIRSATPTLEEDLPDRNNLMHDSNGTLPCPPETIDDMPNPDSKLWKRQDHLILHAIQTSVANSISPLVSRCKAATEAWTKLETTFCKQIKHPYAWSS